MQLCRREWLAIPHSVGNELWPTACSTEGFECMVQGMQRICFTTPATHRHGACPLVTSHAAIQQHRVMPTLSRLTACSLCAASCNSCKLVMSRSQKFPNAEAFVYFCKAPLRQIDGWTCRDFLVANSQYWPTSTCGSTAYLVFGPFDTCHAFCQSLPCNHAAECNLLEGTVEIHLA